MTEKTETTQERKYINPELLNKGQKIGIMTTELENLRKYYVQHGVSDNVVRQELIKHIRKPELHPKLKTQIKDDQSSLKSRWLCFIVIPITIASLIAYAVFGRTGWVEIMEDTECLVENNILSMEITRPLFDCTACAELKEFPVVRDLTKEEFIDKYAYTTVPVLVKEATQNWTAKDTFSFKYFKDIYTKTPEALKAVEEECQFFPYNTDFESLGEMLSMSEERASYKEGEKPWYVGWSNCHHEIQKELRRHYQRPYFLPDEAESSALDWIFMGGPGPGAFIHIDSVKRPSWQAQICGHKTWSLLPAPECESVCAPLNATMSPGDIIVVDTNQWYHSTFIHQGDISITIGSEFD